MKYIKLFENYINELYSNYIDEDEFKSNLPLNIGDFNLTLDFFNDVFDDYSGMFKSIDDAFEYFIKHIRVLDNLFNKGGNVFRVIFTDVVNKNDLGEHWTYDIPYYEKQQYIEILINQIDNENLKNTHDTFIIDAYIPPKVINIKETLMNNSLSPFEFEITITNTKAIEIVGINKK